MIGPPFGVANKSMVSTLHRAGVITSKCSAGGPIPAGGSAWRSGSARRVGGGWLAEQFMKSDTGLVMNIVLGIVGAAVASAILSVIGVHFYGWLGYLIAGFIGACILIWLARMVRGARTT